MTTLPITPADLTAAREALADPWFHPKRPCDVVDVAHLRTALARVDELAVEVAGLTQERNAIATNADRIFCDACDRLDAHSAPGVTLSERIDGLAQERDEARQALDAALSKPTEPR